MLILLTIKFLVMDRIVLKCLPESCEDEFKAMCFVICPQNLIETELFLMMFKRATNAFFEKNLENSEKLIHVATESIESTNIELLQTGLCLLNKIIYRTPTKSTAFLDAVLARAVHAFHSHKCHRAKNDLVFYKCFDPESMTMQGAVLAQILLVLSLFLMGQVHDAKIQLLDLTETLDRWPLIENFGKHNELETFLLHVEMYRPIIMKSSNETELVEKSEIAIYEPLDGYKFDRKIPYASKACDYVSEPDSSSKVYARKALSKDNIVVSEDPQYFQFSAPFLNCDLCETYQEQLFTCASCHYKTYCSRECINMDKDYHQYECYGYKIGIIQTLEVSMLFRCFLSAAKYMSPAFITLSQQYGPIRNAADAWNFIVEYSTANQTEYTIIGEFLSSQPDSKLLTVAQRRQLINTSFRLAVFVYNDTNVIEEYFNQVDLTKNDFIKVIAAMLLRLNVHLTLNSYRNELNYTENDAYFKYKADLRPRINENAFEYFSINANSDFVNCYHTLQEGILSFGDKRLPKITNIQTGINQVSPMSVYIERILYVCIGNVTIQSAYDLLNVDILDSSHIEQSLLKLNSGKRCELIHKFAEYFHNYVVDYFCHLKIQEKTALCLTLKRFNHSCTPNIKIRCLDAGQYLGITATNIEPNTELTVNHYFDSLLNLSREERYAYFKDIGITCKCEACADSTLIKSIGYSSGIFCVVCNQDIEITRELGECPLCYVKYSDLLEEHTTFIAYIQREIIFSKSDEKGNPKNLAILYGTYNSYITMHFSEGHEIRLNGILNFVEYLSSNGFLNHATDILLMLNNSHNYPKINSESFNKDIGFKLFHVIRNVIEQYIENFCIVKPWELDPNYTKMLIAFTHNLLTAQRQYYEEHVEDTDNYETFLENKKEFYKWIKVICDKLKKHFK